jgi:hypothetical protein
MALTGKNFSGLLGRGFTHADQLRLQRAPAVYFRAMGAMVFAIAALLALGGYILLTVPSAPSAAVLTTILILAGLFLVAFIASTAWLIIVATRYKLRRWDKP